MSRRVLKSLMGQRALRGGIGLALGGLVVVSGNPAYALDPLEILQRVTQTTGQTPSADEDVIVETGSPNPGSTGSPQTTTPSPLGSSRFSCEPINGQYTVMYQPESQPGKYYPWATPGNMGGGWLADRRCAEISRRLESYRPDGLLEMQTSVENGYNIVCVTTQKVPACRIVLTVPPGQNPLVTRDRVFQNLTVADSGQQTQAVNTYQDGGRGGLLGDAERIVQEGLSGLGRVRSRSTDGIDLRPFLDARDGGTGANLQSGFTNRRPAPRLNPDRFR